MTVFDFSTILERTERRVRDDLLGAGPKTVGELRSIAGRLRLKYESQLERRVQRAMQHQKSLEEGTTSTTDIDNDVAAAAAGGGGAPTVPNHQFKEVFDKAGGAAGAMAGAAGAFAGGFFAKVKSSGATFGNFNPGARNRAASSSSSAAADPAPTIVDLPPVPSPTTVEAPAQESEGEWAGTDIASATDAISNFSIGDDEEDDML